MKKILALCLGLAILMTSLFVPAAAATSEAEEARSAITGARFLASFNGVGNLLNMWGDTPTSGADIRLYSYTGDSTQEWIITSQGNSRYSLRCAANRAYAINRDSDDGYAILWPYDSGAEDSIMRIRYYTNSYGDVYMYHFILDNYNENLIAEGPGTGAQVEFGTSIGDSGSWAVYYP